MKLRDRALPYGPIKPSKHRFDQQRLNADKYGFVNAPPGPEKISDQQKSFGLTADEEEDEYRVHSGQPRTKRVALLKKSLAPW